MKVDTNGINNKVKPKLNSASSYLNQVANSISSLNIPSSFGYAGTLRSLAQVARDVSTDVGNTNQWVSGVVSKFEAAESKSSSAINSLLGKLDMLSFGGIGATAGKIVGTATSMAIGGGVQSDLLEIGFDFVQSVAKEVQKGISSVGAKISSAWTSFTSSVEKIGTKLLKDTKAKVSKIVTGAINEVSKGINKVTEGITTFAKKGYEKACQINQSIEKGLSEVASHVSTAWKSFCTEVIPEAGKALQSAVASVSNVVIGLVKGIGQFVESLGDLVIIVGSAVGSVFTGIADGVTYVGSLITGNTDEWESITANMWKKTMSHVAEDHVGNAFKDFYENNAIGQWLDKHAIDACKSDGIVTNISSGLGYVAGIVVLTITTLGAGTAVTAGASGLSFATTSAGIATAAGTGKYIQEAWGNARDSSWEGIQKLYQEGEISKEEFDTFVTIRNLTDEQWEEIKKDYQAGKMSKEEFEQIEKIREMPEDWKNFENGWKGLLYGVANGVWEGVQWYVGGKLANWTIKGGSELASSAVRVGADTAFNGLDTPFRTAITAITNGKTWDEAWNEQGGWQSVLTNLGIGLVGSVGGEVFDGMKWNKTSNTLNSSQTCNGLDEAIKITLDKYGDKTSREYIMQELNKGNFSVITTDGGARNFVKTYFAENQQMLNDFISVVGKGKKSDSQMINWMSSVLEKEIANGNTEVRKFLSKFMELKAKYPKITFEIDLNNASFWNTSDQTLKIGVNIINDAGKAVLFHESGHLLFDLVGKGKLPDNYAEILAQAKAFSSNNGTLSQLTEKFHNIDSKVYEMAESNIERWVKSQGYNSIDEYVQSMADIIDDNRSKLFMISKLKKLGFDEKIIEIVKKSNEDISSIDIMKAYINSLISASYDYFYRTQYDYVTAISDIIDAVYLSTGEDIFGNEIYTPYSHQYIKHYYSGEEWNVLQLHELIANFSSLKAMNHNQTLADLKMIFGEDFYNMLEELYNSFFK